MRGTLDRRSPYRGKQLKGQKLTTKLLMGNKSSFLTDAMFALGSFCHVFDPNLWIHFNFFCKRQWILVQPRQADCLEYTFFVFYPKVLLFKILFKSLYLVISLWLLVCKWLMVNFSPRYFQIETTRWTKI